MECKICNGSISGLSSDPAWQEWERANRICLSCRGSFGLSTLAPPPVRPPRPCARCGHTVLVRALLRERVGEWARLSPAGVSYACRRESSFWTGKHASAPDSDAPLGVLDAFVCRGCGFVEWYARDPAAIPIGPEYGTELVDVGTQAPYR
ncbi:MAG TPA: hypothetical protein VFF06_12425 [Polyangia bacterium]|nr:hypothetical protein [Polyangia bacterium]